MPNKTDQYRLHMQFKKVLILLEQHYSTQPTPMLEMIISRYQHANDILRKNNLEDLTKDMFKIAGSLRAYLEAYSDYMNPMLGEMEKAENMLEELSI